MTYLNMTDTLYTGGGSVTFQKVCNNKGFTLLEMIVAIVIAGILMLVAIPNMRDWKLEQDLATKAEAVIAEFDLARTTAQQTNQPVTIQPINQRNWNRGFGTFINSNFATGRGDFTNNDDFVSNFDITDNNIRFSVGTGAQTNPNANIRFLPNGMSGLVDTDQKDVMAVQGNVIARLCRVISGRAVTWTIVMRTSGDTTKQMTQNATDCVGY